MKSHNLLAKLPPQAIYFLRNFRSFVYRLLDPLDWSVRRLNSLGHYPPIHLRRHVGFLTGFEGVSCEFTAYLRLLAGLKRSSRVLDIGAGCGMLELALEDVIGPEGSCVGVDIHGPSIEWAQRTIHARKPNFKFIHADIHHESYWPSGKLTAAQFFETLPETDFDLVIAKSLFTHMLPAELELYFSEMAKRLKPGGAAFFTFFLLKENQEPMVEIPGRFTFTPYAPAPPCWVRYVNSPPSAVAYPEPYIHEQLEKVGLSVEKVYRGTWSGNPEGLSVQDFVIARKK